MHQFSAAKMAKDANLFYVAVASVSFLTFRVFYQLGKANISLPMSLSSKKQWVYLNTLISFVHACVSSVWSIYCFHDKPAMLNDMMSKSLPSTYLLAFLIGYNVHDTWDIVANDFKGSPGLLIHHAVIVTISTVVLYTEQYLPLATALCVIEINSVFLHLRRLMRFHGGNRSQLAYKLNLGALFITFVALRFVFLLWLTACFVYERQMMHLFHFMLGMFGFSVLWVINLILFPRLWRTEFVIKKPRINDHMNGCVPEKVN